MNLDDRASVSILVGAIGGTALWLGHGAAKAIGVPRWLIYMGLATIATYLVDYVTEALPNRPESWIGRPDGPS